MIDNVIRSLFTCDPESGIVFSKKDGKPRGKISTDGYIQVHVKDGKRLMAHRIVWFLHYGSWPDTLIDHINGNPSDNRILNLRLARPTENQANAKKRVDNASGVKGVSFCATTGKWVASLHFNGRRVVNKASHSMDDAIKARREGVRKYFGSFAHDEDLT